MFGSHPFGQSSSSPFGSQPVFGQNANANTNLFAPNPFGNTAPFGTQTGSSFFGSTATGVFGNQNSSPLGSTSVFGASSSPAFGSSTPAFGASSTPAFGSTSSPFGGTSAFGQKPAFGAFGSSSGQTTSPFGSSFQQSQPAFGSSLFGSSAQSSFGNATAPAFGASSAPAFGATTNTSPFGSSGGAFGVSSSPGFGSTSPAFGAASTPAFGASSTLAFGSSNTGLFGASNASAPSFAFGQSAPAFGQSAPAFGQSTPAFGQSAPAFGQSAPAFGQSAPAFGQSAPAFGLSAPAFGQSAPAFGQSAPAFGSSAFGTTTSSPFGGQSNQFGSQASATTFGSPGFGQSAFGSQRGGTRVTPYAATTETDAGTQPPGKLESISAMPTYKDKSHEELRWEDYQLGDKGGPAPANQSVSGVTGFGSQSTTPFGQSLAANPFSSSSNSSNPFAPKTSAFGSSSGFGSSVLPASNPFGSTSSNPFGSTSSNPFGSTSSNPFGSTSSNPFGSTSSNPFGSTSSNPFGSTSSTPSMFNSQSTAFTTTTPSLFGTSNSNTTFGTSNSIFSSSLAQGTTNAFNPSTNFGNSQSSPLFQSTTPSISPFGQSTSAFGQTNAFNTQMNAFNTTSSSAFGGNIFSSNPPFGQTNTSISTPFQTAQPAQTMNSGGFGNFGQPPAVNTVGFGGSTNIIGQSTFGQPAAIQNSVAVQQAPSNPFGTLPTMPQMSIARTSNSPSVQYGISSIPVVDKPVPVRVSSFLTARHISQRRVRLPTRKYHPNVDGLKVPFFRDDEETMVTPKADAFFIPRENPRALVVHPLKPQIPSIGQEKTILSLHNAAQNGNSTEGEASRHTENGYTIGNKEVSSNGNGIKEQSQPSKQIQKSTKVETSKNNNIHSPTKAGSYVTTLTSQRPAIGADIETVVPKLGDSEYYTEPRIQELGAKERSEPGYCQRVKDFTVGRHGYGSIKFIGETDVRGLDLDSLIRFNNREVIVYMDESKKPPIGQGLNKPAEVTLMNIKYISKKTGEQVTSGPMIDKYLDMLKRKAVDQGTQFVSYDPINGDWKFKVSHFSTYKF